MDFRHRRTTKSDKLQNSMVGDDDKLIIMLCARTVKQFCEKNGFVLNDKANKLSNALVVMLKKFKKRSWFK